LQHAQKPDLSFSLAESTGGRRELRRCDQSPFRPTSGFGGATDANAGALVAGRRLGISRRPRRAANAQRSLEARFAVHDACGGCSRRRLRHASKAKAEVVIRLTPPLLSDDMIGLKQAAIADLGIVALPG
jgi:hypothetical protein